MSALGRANVLIGLVSAIEVSWDSIVRSKDARVDVVQMSIAMMALVHATLVILEVIVTFERVPAIVSVMVTVSMVHAIADLDGLEMIVHRRYVLMAVLGMESAQIQLVYAHQATRALIAL